MRVASAVGDFDGVGRCLVNRVIILHRNFTPSPTPPPLLLPALLLPLPTPLSLPPLLVFRKLNRNILCTQIKMTKNHFHSKLDTNLSLYTYPRNRFTHPQSLHPALASMPSMPLHSASASTPTSLPQFFMLIFVLIFARISHVKKNSLKVIFFMCTNVMSSLPQFSCIFSLVYPLLTHLFVY